jgi:hypothetical protein
MFLMRMRARFTALLSAVLLSLAAIATPIVTDLAPVATAQALSVSTTLAPIATRNAGTYTSGTVAVPRLKGREVYVTITGLPAAELADRTLDISIFIEANDSSTATNASSGWYAIAMDQQNGGIQAKFQPPGTYLPFEFGFRLGEDLNAARLRGVLTINHRTSWGVDVTVE